MSPSSRTGFIQDGDPLLPTFRGAFEHGLIGDSSDLVDWLHG
jgi:hypothetical protein